jgi:hypothetical protein
VWIRHSGFIGQQQARLSLIKVLLHNALGIKPKKTNWLRGALYPEKTDKNNEENF